MSHSNIYINYLSLISLGVFVIFLSLVVSNFQIESTTDGVHNEPQQLADAQNSCTTEDLFSPTPEQQNTDNDLTPLADDGGQLLDHTNLPNNLDASNKTEAMSPEDNQATEVTPAATAGESESGLIDRR